MKTKDNASSSIATRLLWTSIGLGAVYWFLESAMSAFIFQKGDFIEQIFTRDPGKLWMRLLTICLFIIFGFYTQVIINKINKRNQLQKELEKLNEGLERRIIELTEQLEEANKVLKGNEIKQAQAECRKVFQHAVKRILTESFTFDETASKIIRAICEDWGWTTGEFWALDRQANILRYVEIQHSLPVDFSEFEKNTRHFTFRLGVGLPGRIWATGEPAWIVDVTKDANFLRCSYAAKVGLNSAFGFPIRFGSKILGIMIFFSREIHRPDADLVNMFIDIGAQIGEFMERNQPL